MIRFGLSLLIHFIADRKLSAHTSERRHEVRVGLHEKHFLQIAHSQNTKIRQKVA